MPPPQTPYARLRLIEGDETPWIEAEILGVEQIKPRRYRVRLRFLVPCPNFLLQLAILGAEEEPEPETEIETLVKDERPVKATLDAAWFQ
jgi:hypothetical protein